MAPVSRTVGNPPVIAIPPIWPSLWHQSVGLWVIPLSLLSPLSDHHCGTSQSDCGLGAAPPAEVMDEVVVGHHGQTTRLGAAVMPPPSETLHWRFTVAWVKIIGSKETGVQHIHHVTCKNFMFWIIAIFQLYFISALADPRGYTRRRIGRDVYVCNVIGPWYTVPKQNFTVTH